MLVFIPTVLSVEPFEKANTIMAKPRLKTQVERMRSIRKQAAPPSKLFTDRKKQADKRACRGRYHGDS